MLIDENASEIYHLLSLLNIHDLNGCIVTEHRILPRPRCYHVVIFRYNIHELFLISPDTDNHIYIFYI